MTSREDRQILLAEIARAHAAGTRLSRACAEAGIDPRTRQCWLGAAAAGQAADRRPQAERPVPAQALTAEERARMVTVANEPRFADAPPARIVPAFAALSERAAAESRKCCVMLARRKNSVRPSCQRAGLSTRRIAG